MGVSVWSVETNTKDRARKTEALGLEGDDSLAEGVTIEG